MKALTPSFQDNTFSESHGVDIILGGHYHFYFVSKGVDSWDGFDNHGGPPGTEDGFEDVLVIKSGTDFRELTEVVLVLEDAPEGSLRRKIIKNVKGKISLCS